MSVHVMRGKLSLFVVRYEIVSDTTASVQDRLVPYLDGSRLSKEALICIDYLPRGVNFSSRVLSMSLHSSPTLSSVIQKVI